MLIQPATMMLARYIILRAIIGMLQLLIRFSFAVLLTIHLVNSSVSKVVTITMILVGSCLNPRSFSL